jgi:hypothetical protein
MIVQGGITKSLRQQPDQTQRLKQGHYPLLIKTQDAGLLSLDDLGSINPFKGFMAYLAVLNDLFDFRESSVGVNADISRKRGRFLSRRPTAKSRVLLMG